MIIYVVNQYPNLSETFIAREIEGLRDHGVSVTVVSLKKVGAALPRPALPPRRHRQGEPPSPSGKQRPPDDRSASPGSVQFREASPALIPPAALSIASLRAQLRFLCRKPAAYLSLLPKIAVRESKTPVGILRGVRRFLQAAALAREIRRLNPIRIHAQFAHVTADAGQVLSALLDLPFSVSVHAWDIYTQPPGKIERRVGDADFVVACTQHGAAHLQDLLGEKLHAPVHLMHHGLPVAEFTPATPDSHRRILAIGRLIAKKGLSDLIEACSQLAENGLQFQCTIVGEGPEYENIKAKIDESGLSDRIVLTGAKTQEEVREALLTTTVFVLPSVVDEDGDRDGLPNVILEAMACGIPVVTTTASAADEAVGNDRTGLLVPPHDPTALAAAIQQLLENPGRARDLGHAAREKAKAKFDLAKTIPPLAELLLRGNQ